MNETINESINDWFLDEISIAFALEMQCKMSETPMHTYQLILAQLSKCSFAFDWVEKKFSSVFVVARSTSLYKSSKYQLFVYCVRPCDSADYNCNAVLWWLELDVSKSRDSWIAI